MATGTIRIGGASAGFIDSAIAIPQLLRDDIDYIVMDFMGEGNMPILARRREAGTGTPFMSEFVDAMRANLPTLLSRGVRVIANAGALDPVACAAALEKVAADLHLTPRIGYVVGDNLMHRLDELRSESPLDMFSGASLPDAAITTANAYLGAIPIVDCLDRGADIVVTGRVVDSAPALAALMHHFGWSRDDYDLLAGGTLIGHLLECGAHVTGGLFTDWRSVPDWSNIGYPIAECAADGTAVITKPAGTGGLVSLGTVAEQLLYEIGDPQRYFVPDVTCDFSGVRIEAVGENRVRVSHARGYPPTSTYKVILTYDNGWRGIASVPVSGREAVAKAQRIGDALVDRTRRMLRETNQADWRATRIDILGSEGAYGAQARGGDSREVVCRIVADHDERCGAALMVAEHFSAGVSMAPGNACMPMGVDVVGLFRLFPMLIEKSRLPIEAVVDGVARAIIVPTDGGYNGQVDTLDLFDEARGEANHIVPLIDLAWSRSGDKGDISNVGVIARDRAALPYIRAALTPEALADWFAHIFADGGRPEIEIFELPGLDALNIVMRGALDGGITASLRFDPMGKGLAQQLLEHPVPVPRALVDRIEAAFPRQNLWHAGEGMNP